MLVVLPLPVEPRNKITSFSKIALFASLALMTSLYNYRILTRWKFARTTSRLEYWSDFDFFSLANADDSSNGIIYCLNLN
jgi:hypothetical protein